MSAANDTVSNRIDTLAATLSPVQVGTALAGVTLAVFLLLFAQEPLVHDAMHNGRHLAGVVCH